MTCSSRTFRERATLEAVCCRRSSGFWRYLDSCATTGPTPVVTTTIPTRGVRSRGRPHRKAVREPSPLRSLTNSDLQPVLRGQLVELRPLRPDDFDALYAVASDPLLWEQHPARNRHEEPIFLEFLREAIVSGGALIAIDVATQQIIGSSRFHGYDSDRGEIEIGWTFLARAYWGGLYNGEMKRLMLQHAFTFADRVVFLIGPQNRRSRRAVEKIGGVQIADRVDPTGRTVVVYQITREAFAGKAE